VGYDYYEQLFERLSQLEEQEEQRILNERMDRMDRNPAATKSWKDIRRDPHE